MSLDVRCDVCGHELNVPGALVFGPPDDDGNVTKYHVCIFKCWDDILGILTGDAVAVEKETPG